MLVCLDVSVGNVENVGVDCSRPDSATEELFTSHMTSVRKPLAASSNMMLSASFRSSSHMMASVSFPHSSWNVADVETVGIYMLDECRH
jgi:hypothetical protein